MRNIQNETIIIPLFYMGNANRINDCIILRRYVITVLRLSVSYH